MTVNEWHLSYLNKLVDQCSNTCQHSINIKPTNADNSALKKLRPILKLLSLKLMKESELQSMRIFLAKVTLKLAKRNIDSVLKTNPWTDKTKDINRKNNRKFLSKKNLLLSKLWMCYCP